jgi:hypothetical protein
MLDKLVESFAVGALVNKQNLGIKIGAEHALSFLNALRSPDWNSYPGASASARSFTSRPTKSSPARWRWMSKCCIWPRSECPLTVRAGGCAGIGIPLTQELIAGQNLTWRLRRSSWRLFTAHSRCSFSQLRIPHTRSPQL